MIASFIILLVYSCLAGSVEAVLYSRKGSDSFRWNEHILFVAKMVTIGILYLFVDTHGMVDKSVVVACWILSHPLFHDGAYYETRRRIDQPDYRWWSDSRTSSADIEIPSWLRICLASFAFSIFTTYWQFIR